MSESKSKAPIYEWVSKTICREGETGLPPFPIKLHIVEHVRGEPIIYEEVKGYVLQRRSEEFVSQQILTYSTRVAPKGMLIFDAREAKNCAHFWKYYSTRMTEEILPVAQKSEPGFTFHRLPWDFTKGDCPTWDEMFSRLENAEAIMAWIGSLFEPDSDRQQYCWIHGEGGDGKGALNRFLKKIFNGAYKPETVPAKGDKFWTSSLLDARVVVFPDCNNYNFPTTGLFKQITGDDPIKVEFKGENAFSAELVCKLLFLSNQRANITGQRSDTRRAIFSEMAPITGAVIPTKIYDAYLWDEGSAFLHKCHAKYKELCPEHGAVPVNAEIIDRLVNDNEEQLEVMTLRNFDIAPESDKLKIARERWAISPCRLHSILDELRIGDNDRRRYLEFIKRKFKVERKRVKLEDGSLEYRYLGIKEAAMRPVNEVLGSVPPSRYSQAAYYGSTRGGANFRKSGTVKLVGDQD